uniref:Uncharacterized protein AlNc14C247G9585 n=1 Tax=Albugo laibachii Nc14 TaxID=890382 RepID=F0WTA0_9STRA|nr:conserved hypothetical protein [Albugo laibachii Nc14]|eukprot:CCA24589.1 conserved hypothetical protein [Albugo laibachii Nc14]
MNSCEACSPDSVCIAEQRNRALYAGNNSIEVNVCNWWLTSAPSAAYRFQFSLTNAITCDNMNVLNPVVDSIVAKSECPESGDNMPCKLDVIFRDHFDWAIAIQTRGKANVLLATVVGPKAVNGAVPVGTFFPAAITPSISPFDDLISVCSSRIAIMGTHFSQVPSCNTVQLCSGAADAKECSDLIQNGLNVSSVVCKGEYCLGDIVLRDHIACMLSKSKEKNAILAALWVAGTSAGKAVIGSVIPPTAEIIAVRGAYIGSSKLAVETKDVCATEKFSLSKVSGTRLEPVHSFNVMTGKGTAETGIILSDAFDGQEEYQLDTSQCGVKSAALYKFKVRKSKEEEATEGSRDATLRPSTTKLSTQSSGTSSSGWIIGLIVISIAVAGFGADWWYHRRKYLWGNPEPSTSAMPYSSDSTL